MRISDWSSDVCSSDLVMPMPTIARVNGHAMGGGVGLTACCDMAVAADNALFALSEVKLGIVPGAISPYVLRAIGPHNARRYFLTGERFDAATACRIGLVNAVAPQDGLDAQVDVRSEEHTSELLSLMRISYAVLCLNTNKN